eukprot:g3278.t1
MTKVRKKGARAWRHHGKFIFILMLLTAPSSTATRLHERGSRGGGGRPVVLDEHSSSYIIDGKSAVEYGTRFTKTLVHHLEAHGVNAKHESRSGMYRLLDNVLDEMRSGAERGDDGGLQWKEPNMDKSWTGDDNDVATQHNDGQWKFPMKEEAQRAPQSEDRKDYPLPPFRRSSVLSDIARPTIDASRESLMQVTEGSFETCWRVHSLLADLANATDGGIKESAEFMAQVESYVEESTPCQTPTSSCLTKTFRDSHSKKYGCGGQDLSEGTCVEISALQGRVEKVIERHSGLGIVDNVRNLLGKIREDCKAVVPHGRRLAECPTIPISGDYKLTADCSLSSTITVPAGETLTIVGTGNPKIDRGESGRHFVVHGHLKMTGVTLTKGYSDVSRVAHMNDCVEDLRED